MKSIIGMKRGLAMAFAGLIGCVFGIDAPTGLSVEKVSFAQAACNIDCSAKLSWTAPSGSPTGYKVYRRLAAGENPTLAGEVTTTSFTDTAATVGETYLYTVTAVDADGESAESEAVSFRKVQNVATKANGTWSLSGTMTSGWGGYAIANMNDGNVSTGTRAEGWGLYKYLFTDTSKPLVTVVRLYCKTDSNVNRYQTLSGLCASASDVVDIQNPSIKPSATTYSEGQWTVCTVHSSYAETTWTGFTYGGGNWYPGLGEFEAYGYVPTTLLGAPSGLETAADKTKVSLSWTAGVNVSSYKVWRKPDGGAWTAVASGLTGCTYDDSSVDGGVTYIYRVAAVSAAGDELSSSERSAYVPAGAQVWWNFLNVKSIAYPGAAAWEANPRPHYLSRDREGTILMAAMSTDHGGLPVMTFDLEALTEGDGELLSRETDAKSWWLWGKGAYVPWQSQNYCWKGAAATDDLIFWANGTVSGTEAGGSTVAVVNRGDDSEDIYSIRDVSGNPLSFWMNGGLEASADGNYLYSNCGTSGEKNKIYKFAIDRNAKTLRVVASYTVIGITYIRNFTVYTVGGNEIAVFGEGEGGGKLGVLDLATGVSTLMTASDITGKIANVKLADTTDGRYLVAQNEDGFVAVYAFDASAKTITLEKTIPAATMKALYGASGDFECRNLEMTADGRYAFVVCNGGPDTRLSVIGATLKTIPEVAPASLTVTADLSTCWQAKLTWTAASTVTATGIRVLRAQTGKAGYATLADLPLGTTEYTDATAVGGVAYTYAVAYVNSFEGKTVAGPTVTAACKAWQSLMPYKSKVIASKAVDDFAKVFDGDLKTQASTQNNGPILGVQFTEPVIFGASRISAIDWAADLGRLDGVKIFGGLAGQTVKLSGSTITSISGTTKLAQTGSPRDASWFGVASSDTSSAWDCLVLQKDGEWSWYGDLREVEFYGAVPTLKAAAEAKTSEAAPTVAPTLSANAGTLTWTGEPNETVAVVIYRARMAEGSYKKIAEVAAGVGTYTDTEASTAVQYHYRAAFVTEYQGVNLEGVASASAASTKPVAVESVLLTENGAATKTYGSAVKYAGGFQLSDANKAFDGATSTYPMWYGQDAGWGKNLYVGYNFNEPVKITKAKVTAYKQNDNTWTRVSFRVSPDAARESTNPVNYLFPNNDGNAVGWGGAFAPTACTTLKYFSEMTDNGVWEDANLSTDWTRCAYLWGNAYDVWYGSVREFELWGYTESMWQAVQPKTVVQPVANVTARMDDTTLTLNWTLANDAATEIVVKRRIASGAWTEVATLAGNATTFVDAAVSIGKYNEYRFEVTDGDETVWAAEDFAICPLLTQGTRTAIGCTKTTAWDYLDVKSGAGFAATFELAGSSAAALGLTPGTGNGKYCNLTVRRASDGAESVKVQRHWVYGSTIGFYAFDAENPTPPYSYYIVWPQAGSSAGEGNMSTRFKICKNGSSYQLRTGVAGSALADTASYTFVGEEPIGRDPCQVGVQIADPNLSTLSQIAPVKVKVNGSGLTLFIR